MRRFPFRLRPDPKACRQARSVLQAYLDGELDDVRTNRVSAHLAVCRRCGLDRDVYVQIKASLSRHSRDGADELALRRLRLFATGLATGALAAEETDSTASD